jgi:hypothetical protein
MDAVRILRVLDRLYRSSAFCLPHYALGPRDLVACCGTVHGINESHLACEILPRRNPFPEGRGPGFERVINGEANRGGR